MPLFKKASTGKTKDEFQKRLQHQLFVAEGNPEPIIDLSECNLKEVPASAFSLSSVLNKEVLLLHKNQISVLFPKGQGSANDLKTLRVLDLHSNRLKQLPDSMCDLINLQVLNLEDNVLKCLPEDIGSLKCLQSLNVKKNQLHTLPKSIGSLASIRTLDISENNIREIPAILCHARTLETLIADWSELTYPGKDVTKDGSTEAVMKALCEDCHLEYVTPSNFVLTVLSPHSSSNTPSPLSDAIDLQNHIDTSLIRHVTDGERERVDMEAFEREMHEQEERQAQLLEREVRAQQDVIEQMAREQIQEQNNLDKFTKEADSDREAMVASINVTEKKAANLISQLMAHQSQSQKMEELLEEMEKERQTQEDYFTVKHEESESLRKREIIAAMESLLRDNRNFEALCQQQDTTRKQFISSALQSEVASDALSSDVLASADLDQAELWRIISDEEQLQKAAFEALMLREDTRHRRLMKEISLVERQLAELSRVEAVRQTATDEAQMKLIEHRRDELAQMLLMLMDQRDVREKELKKVMVEMDRHREDTQTDYWLVHYQRLLDRKPEQLISQERELDVLIVKILEGADAAEYIPLFARHRMTLENVVTLTEKDLQSMGIHELGTRKSIMKKIEKYLPQMVDLGGAVADDPLQKALGTSSTPSAPPVSELDNSADDIVARGTNSECCICMEKASSVIFLNCGHVCCCSACASTVQECPLCRGLILRRVQLSFT